MTETLMRKNRWEVLLTLHWSIFLKNISYSQQPPRGLWSEFSLASDLEPQVSRVSVCSEDSHDAWVTQWPRWPCPFKEILPPTQTKWTKGHFMQPQKAAEVAHRTCNSTSQLSPEKVSVTHQRHIFLWATVPCSSLAPSLPELIFKSINTAQDMRRHQVHRALSEALTEVTTSPSKLQFFEIAQWKSWFG